MNIRAAFICTGAKAPVACSEPLQKRSGSCTVRPPHTERRTHAVQPHEGDVMFWYRTETKGIQRWILDAGRLRDLQGGSELIERLTSAAERLAKAAGGDVVQAAAGGMTARFDTLQGLQTFAAEWPMRVAYAAPGLHVVQGWIEQSHSMSDAVASEMLFARVAAMRNVVTPEFPEATPWLKRSALTGGLAVPSGQGQPRGASDRAASARARHRSPSDPDFGPVVGVVHIDGTGVGAEFKRHVVSVDALEKFSARLSAAAKSATKRANDPIPAAKFRLIVAGGDDVTAIVDASFVLDFVGTWIREFEQGTNLRAGAGVVFCGANYPFAMAYEHAERLCAESKVGAQSSRVCIRRITTALDAGAQEAHAWDLDELQALRDAAKLIGRGSRKLARGTLRTWLTLHGRKDAAQADAFWQRIEEVAEERAFDALKKFAGQAGVRLDNPAERYRFLRDVLAISSATRGAP